MTTIELVENYPSAAAVVREWFVNKMLESVKESNVPEDFKQMMRDQGVSDERLVAMMDASPRLLLDVLDQNNIIIGINYDNGVFRYSFNGDTVESIDYTSRRDAERDAIEDAFIMLDAKLKTNERSDSTAGDKQVSPKKRGRNKKV